MLSPKLEGYFCRMKGQRYDASNFRRAPPPPPTRFVVLLSSFVGSFIGIAIVSSLTFNSQWFLERNTPVLAGSFGASAVLIYGAIESPLAQPRNVTLMMTVAMLVNNVARRYPTHWWKPKDRKIVVVDQDLSTALADFTNPDDEHEDCCTNVGAEEPLALKSANTMVQPLEEITPTTASPSLHPGGEPQLQLLSPSLSHDSHAHPSTPHHVHPHHHQSQFAVYYGGDREEALKEGERWQRSSSRMRPQSDLEPGEGHIDSPRPASVVIEVRGSPHLSRNSST
ncbi:hypothetical protein EMPS_04063 [Entomortierella parvispora]|uniref:HPP transmembrane region domain-containing protein n=1 Tax=Entomortierella parvispora TaxID=205924 RepID=A0A9P3H7S8_9FUNG|nr:hypothetical protein EMPS_04063 [Entomortierella parvispora]